MNDTTAISDMDILRGMYRIVEGTTVEELREMGIHATVGYKKPKARAHWITLPYPSLDGLLWIGMPRSRMERCILLGGLVGSPKPTLGRLLKTVAKDAVYAYTRFTNYSTIQRGEGYTTLRDFTTTTISEEDGGLMFRERVTGRRPIRIPNTTRVSLLDEEEITLRLPGLPKMWLCDHRHRAVQNPYKAGESDYLK